MLRDAQTEHRKWKPSLDFCLSVLQGIRVEVNGQVLSQGGDVAADQVTDTTSATPVRRNPAFLPAAVIVGLDYGVPLEVRIPKP